MVPGQNALISVIVCIVVGYKRWLVEFALLQYADGV